MAPDTRTSDDEAPAEWQPWHDTAGPGTIFTRPTSPFIVKNSVLKQFNPQNAIVFIKDTSQHWCAREIVLEGFRAWTICPSEIVKHRRRSIPRTTSNQFIHQAMLLSAMGWLSLAFDFARTSQLEMMAGTEKHPPERGWSANTLLKSISLRRFPYEIFFALGGMSAAIITGSLSDFRMKMENQKAPAQSAIALTKVLLDRLVAPSHSHSRTLGLGSAQADASLLLGSGGKRKGYLPDTIGEHWRKMQLSAPLLYAAALDGGQPIRDWLFSTTYDYPEDFASTNLDTWLDAADAVARTLQSGSLLTNWQPLAANVAALPADSANLQWPDPI